MTADGGVDAAAGSPGIREPAVPAAVLRSGRPSLHAGRNDYELVSPVRLRDGRHAFVVRRDRAALDGQLAELRRTLAALAALSLVAGLAVFHLAGGRALLRSHRIALRRASRDGLTDLPNGRAFHDDLARAAAGDGAKARALALVDLDDFGHLNDRFGRAHGDAVLRRVAAALAPGAGDRAYRIGGDEFAVLLGGDGRSVGERLARALRDAGVAATVGIAAIRAGHESDAGLAEAGAALQEARRDGRGDVVHFDDVRDRVAVTRPQEVRALHRLLDAGVVGTAFQPIWDLASGALLGVEALSRPAPDSGLSDPAHAFDVAEQVGRVRDLDALCVRSALRVASDLPPGALLFLNVAPRTLDVSGDDDWLLAAVRAAGLEPERVVVEVTERSGARMAPVLRTLRRLRAQGFQLAVDDVGAGNSGLEMLREVGPEFVKLDRSIVADAPHDASARGVFLAIAAFAGQTGAFVIAEGIEDRVALDYVRTVGDALPRDGTAMIQGGQGYGLGRPAPSPPLSGGALLVAAAG